MVGVMKMVVFPSVSEHRHAVFSAASTIGIVNAATIEEAAREIEDADAFFGVLTPELLACSRKLRWFQAPTASLERVLFPALVEHPSVLTNMRGLYSDVIADHVLGLVLCFSRNLHVYIRNQSQGLWAPVGGENEPAPPNGGPGVTTDIDLAHESLAEQTMGIVGLGEIGREIARRAKAFGMRVIGVDPAPQGESVDAWRPPSEIDWLLESSDYVVVAAPHTPTTERLFRLARFERMKPTARFINIGRGAIVVTEDLVGALSRGIIAGAALDVVDPEPLPSDHPLWRMPNVIITPHIAGRSPKIAARHLAVVEENLRRFAAGEPLRNVASKRDWC